MDSQKNDEIELSDEKREELKGFVPHDDNSFSKSYQKFSYYTQNQNSEYSNRMNEQKKNLLKELQNDANTKRRMRP